MPESQKASASNKVVAKDRAAEIANTLEWLVTAFLLAFVVRAFVVEAFRIPTGSMAHTLMGAHFRLRCSQCGYKYDYGFVPERYKLAQDTIPRGDIPPMNTRCPSCGNYQPAGGSMPIANGDRILVLKCLYQFFEPKRWDVIVFKNPLDPTINYIKRLVGRPGETVEIIDGDVYIDGRIARKPPKVQRELWFPVYNNDYQPIKPADGLFNGHAWKGSPFRVEDSKWQIDSEHPTRFTLNSAPEDVQWLSYDTSRGNDFRATYAYNYAGDYRYRPYSSDLMTRFYVRTGSSRGRIGVSLGKYLARYKGWVDFQKGQMVITRVFDGRETVLQSRTVEGVVLEKPAMLKFANVDHLLTLEFGDQKLYFDLGRDPNDAGPIREDVPPQVEIFGSGELTIWHVAIFRDIHYTNPYSGSWASRGNPFRLGADEFFALGDNSPNSQDSRAWRRRGRGNNGVSYRPGVVPRDYLVGKALFVYWPSFFRPYGKRVPVFIPNVGRMRFIYGGSDNQP